MLDARGAPPAIEHYRYVGIAALPDASSVLVWADECFDDATARGLAARKLRATPRWLDAGPNRFMSHDDVGRGTTFVCTLDPTRTSLLWHSRSDGPIATVASHETMRILLEAGQSHDAAVDLIEAFACASAMRIGGDARWSLIEEAFPHVHRWMFRLEAASGR
jgi:hypothetical protein